MDHGWIHKSLTLINPHYGLLLPRFTSQVILGHWAEANLHQLLLEKKNPYFHHEVCVDLWRGKKDTTRTVDHG